MRTSKPWGIPLPHLRAWRTYHDLSRKQLASQAGLTKYTVTNIELGRYGGASYLTIAKLAKALGITTTQLIESPPKEEARCVD